MPMSPDQKNAADRVFKSVLEGLGHMPPLPNDFALMNALPNNPGAVMTRNVNSTLNLYVDGVGGSDSNDGLTAQTAVQTIEVAHQKAPVVLGPGAKGMIK